MKRIAIAAAAVAVLALAASSAVAGRSGKSNVYQLTFEQIDPAFDGAVGMAHVWAPEVGGEIRIVVNLKGLDPDTKYKIRTQGQILGGEGLYPNRAGNLNVSGTIQDTGTEAGTRGRIRLKANGTLLAWTTERYAVGE